MFGKLEDILRGIDGADVDSLEHIPSISHYCMNYYAHKENLFFGDSDDDHTTEWYLVSSRGKSIKIGESILPEDYKEKEKIIIDRKLLKD